MRREKHFPRELLTVIILILLFLSSCQNNSAHPTKNTQQSISTLASQSDQPEKIIALSTATIASTISPSQEGKTTLKVVNQASQIVERWKAKMMQGSGWLHLKYSNSSEVDRTFTFHEEWLFYNEQGLIEKSVRTVKDQIGNIAQQAIFNNGTMVNKQLGDREENLPPDVFHPDFGFLYNLKFQDARGVPISVQDVDYNGAPSTTFTYQIRYGSPIPLGNSPAPVESITEFGSFDKKTDMLNQYIIRYKLADGREMVFDQVEVLSIEKVDPPQEVIDLIETIVK